MKTWSILFAAVFGLTVVTVIALGGVTSPMPPQEIELDAVLIDPRSA